MVGQRNLYESGDFFVSFHTHIARTYLQTYYSNGVFGNIYFQLDNTKR